jgi:hypothetical protein
LIKPEPDDAEQAHAADRFAREILAILTVSAARSRRLMGKPLGGSHHCQSHLGCSLPAML